MPLASCLSRPRLSAAPLVIGITLVAALLVGCDQAPGVEPPGGDPPVLTEFEFGPHSVALGDPDVEEDGDQVRFAVTMRVNVVDPDGDVERVAYVVRSPYAGRTPISNGELALASGSQYAGTATVSVPRGEVGVYTVLVYAVDETGSLSDNVRGMLTFSGQSEPPVILEVSAPDTVRRPLEGEDPAVLRLSATVTDPDGLSSISEVVFWNVERPSSVIEMADDGESFGDEFANDGVFTRTVQIESGNAPGETVLAFQATDRSGLKSNVVERTIVVE